MKIDIASLRAHLGRRIEETDEASVAPMCGMTITFGRPEPAPVRGEPSPGWHWCFFLPMAPRSSLGADGLPTTAGVLPPMPLPRRMFAGGRVTFHAPIQVGDALRRETELSDIQLREGGTGTMIFTTVTRRIYTPRGLAVTEEQDTVFREAVDPSAPVRTPKRDPAPTDVAWRRTITPDPVTLFRYSALTPQPAPYSLRSHLRNAGGTLSRAGGARALLAAMPARPPARQCRRQGDPQLLDAGAGAALRHRALHRDRPADYRGRGGLGRGPG